MDPDILAYYERGEEAERLTSTAEFRLERLARIEDDPALIGASAHLIALAARK
jgi:hypothetical protein